jgi:hypothetical protein
MIALIAGYALSGIGILGFLSLLFVSESSVRRPLTESSMLARDQEFGLRMERARTLRAWSVLFLVLLALGLALLGYHWIQTDVITAAS